MGSGTAVKVKATLSKRVSTPLSNVFDVVINRKSSVVLLRFLNSVGKDSSKLPAGGGDVLSVCVILKLPSEMSSVAKPSVLA